MSGTGDGPFRFCSKGDAPSDDAEREASPEEVLALLAAASRLRPEGLRRVLALVRRALAEQAAGGAVD